MQIRTDQITIIMKEIFLFSTPPWETQSWVSNVPSEARTRSNCMLTPLCSHATTRTEHPTVPHCTCSSDGSFTQNPSMLPLDLLPSSLARENFCSHNNSCIFRPFPQLRNFLENGEDTYSVVQRATGCEHVGQKQQACLLRFLWKGRHNTGAYDESQK